MEGVEGLEEESEEVRGARVNAGVHKTMVSVWVGGWVSAAVASLYFCGITECSNHGMPSGTFLFGGL